MLYLRSSKINFIKFAIVAFVTLMASSHVAKAQYYEMNLRESDDYPLQFGFNFGANIVRFNLEKHQLFLKDDSVYVIEPLNNAGVHLGLSSTLAISKRFLIRFNPTLMVAERYLNYQLKYKDLMFNAKEFKMKVASGIITFPLEIKFQSDRIRNFRTYLFGGVFFSTDLEAAPDLSSFQYQVELKRKDYGVDGGIGFNFFLPYFIFSPEIKVSWGLSDLNKHNVNLYSSALERVSSKSVQLTMRFEGVHF